MPDDLKCRWCDAMAVDEKTTHPAIIRSVKGIKTVVQTTTTAPACLRHMEIVEAPDPVVERMRRAREAKAWKARQGKLV